MWIPEHSFPLPSVPTTERPNRPTPAQFEEILLRADHAQVIATLARGMAHDLRGPLQALTLLADPHADFLGQGEGARLRKVMSDSVANLANTVTRFGQVYAPGEPDPGPLIAEELFGAVTELQRYQRGLPAAEIAIRSPRGLPALRGIEPQLHHLLLSLVINAKEAMHDSDAPRITLAAEPAEGGVRLLIEDTGPGVSPEVGQHAFDPFFTTREGHLGLGLSVARWLAERHGGTLALKDREGSGTRAVLVLPAWNLG